MIVMLGDKKASQEHALHFKRACRADRNEFFVVLVEASHELRPLRTKRSEKLRDGIRVVIRVKGLSIFTVGGSQRLPPGLVVVEPRQIQRAEIKEMADMLLYRPLLAVPPGQNVSRQGDESGFNPRGRAPQTLDDVRVTRR